MLAYAIGGRPHRPCHPGLTGTMSPMQNWPVTNARRFEVYVRWSLYVFLAALPVQYGLLMAGGYSGGARGRLLVHFIILFALSVVLTAFNLLAACWSFDRVMQGPAPVPRRFVA